MRSVLVSSHLMFSLMVSMACRTALAPEPRSDCCSKKVSTCRGKGGGMEEEDEGGEGMG